MIQLACVVDNTVYSHLPLWGEQGVAFFVETGSGNILFDTGWSGTVLLHNMRVLGIEPAAIDALVLSHAHYDHSGGLPALLDRIRGIPFHAHSDLFRERFTLRDGTISPVGMPLDEETLQGQMLLRLSIEPVEILPGVWTTGEIRDRPGPEGRADHDLVRAPDGWRPDPYRDDMSLVLETGAGLVVVCGCCHAGLLNTIAHVQRTFGKRIVAIAGGTHLGGADAAHLQRVIEMLEQLDIPKIYPNHCTGLRSFVALARALGERVAPCPAGTRLEFAAA